MPVQFVLHSAHSLAARAAALCTRLFDADTTVLAGADPTDAAYRTAIFCMRHDALKPSPIRRHFTSAPGCRDFAQISDLAFRLARIGSTGALCQRCC